MCANNLFTLTLCQIDSSIYLSDSGMDPRGLSLWLSRQTKLWQGDFLFQWTRLVTHELCDRTEEFLSFVWWDRLWFIMSKPPLRQVNLLSCWSLPTPMCRCVEGSSVATTIGRCWTIHEQIAAAGGANDQDSTSLDKHVPNGSVSTSRVSNVSPSSHQAQVAEQDFSSRSKQKSYVMMPDEEVEKLQQHAQRVGYTVSTI